MRETALLQLSLGLTAPWAVSRGDFDPEARRLDIRIDFVPGSRFACPTCGGADCPAYDTERKTWRHLNFFQHQAYLNARVPRIVGEHDTRLWRVVHHYVDQARARTGAADVTRVAIDETAARRGHNYITLFADIDQARVLFATEGNDAATFAFGGARQACPNAGPSPPSPATSPRMAAIQKPSKRSAST